MSSSDSDLSFEKPTKAIPPELSFEAILDHNTLPPYCLQDFMNYLLQTVHQAENLQFYLWLRDYNTRFSAAMDHERALSPPWDPIRNGPLTDNGSRIWQKENDCRSPLRLDTNIRVMEFSSPISAKGSFRDYFPSPIEKGNPKGLKWQPFTIQPFRAEIEEMIALYLTPGSPRELNLSEKDRTFCLHALQHTTHPTAFTIPARETTDTLINYSHPNFIRWADANSVRQPRRRTKQATSFRDVFRLAARSLMVTRSNSRKVFMQEEVYHVWRRT